MASPDASPPPTVGAVQLGERMNKAQWLAVAVCVFLNVIDGFDILVMATAAASVAKDLQISTEDLGLVLSASLVGMMLGAMFVSPLADRIGRRPVILACLAFEFIGMLLAGLSSDLAHLAVFRLMTGFGVGGIMPVINTAVAELSSPSQRNLAITVQAIGYPLGGLAAALLGAAVLETHDWRFLLQLACLPTAAAFILVLRYLPESVDYLVAKRPRGALDQINRALRTLGKPALTELPSAVATGRQGLSGLFCTSIFSAFSLFALTVFLTQFSFYFFLSWLPTVLAPHLAALDWQGGGSILLNLGGIAGDIVFGILCVRMSARSLTLGALTMAFACIVWLGSELGHPLLSMSLPIVAGGALFAAMAGLYATAPRIFPPLLRAAGTGISFSLGRLGGALAPVVGGIALGRASLDTGTALIFLAAPLMGAALLLSRLSAAAGDPVLAVSPAS